MASIFVVNSADWGLAEDTKTSEVWDLMLQTYTPFASLDRAKAVAEEEIREYLDESREQAIGEDPVLPFAQPAIEWEERDVSKGPTLREWTWIDDKERPTLCFTITELEIQS